MGRGGRSSGQEPRAQRNPENGQASADPAYESNLSRSVTGANPNYLESDRRNDNKYTDNCANVAYAFEARMRGEDATAASVSRTMETGGWRDAMKGQEWKPIAGATSEAALADMERIMRAEGPNARFAVQIMYDESLGGGHLFNAVNDSNGRPRFIEAQSGVELTREQMVYRFNISQLSASTEPERFMGKRYDRKSRQFVEVERTRTPITPQISRIDNLEFDPKRRRSWDASKRRNQGY